METEIHLLIVTPEEQEYQQIETTLASSGQFICHWHSRLGGLEKLITSGDYHLLLLQYHWQYKTAQMLLHRLQNQAEPLPAIVFTEFLEQDVDQQVISSGAADYFTLESATAEHLDRTLRYALVRHNHERRLSQLAHFDDLCGVANRTLFADRLQHAINVHKRNKHRFALMYVDLDHFKRINDQYGHKAGDETLVACANRLRESLRQSDSLARLSGDEFAILVDAVDQNAGLALLAEKIIHNLCQPIQLSNGIINIGCSVGIAVYPDAGQDAESLFRHADSAMYDVKRMGGGSFSIYEASSASPVRTDDLTQIELLRAIKREEICIRYQPRVDLESGRIVAVEALMRWSHPSRGLLAPTEFFALAESSGLLATLSYWVLKEAVCQWAQLNSELDQDVELVVNIAGAMLREIKLVDRLRQSAQENGLPDLNGLELEISQSDWLKYASSLAGVSIALDMIKVGFSIDGVGRGFLPLGDMSQDIVKSLVIDRDLIADAELDVRAERSVAAMAALGNAMEKVTVAQGVENLQQLRLLQAYGCDRVQGFFTSSPLSLADLRTRLLQQKMGRLTMLS